MDAGGTGGAINPYSPPGAAIDDAAPRPVSSGGFAFKSTIGLAKAAAALMAADALLEVVGGINAVLTIGVMRRVQGGEDVPAPVLSRIDNQATAIMALAWTILIPAAVLYCVFVVRSNKNARAFGAPMSVTPGWAAGWLFVPVASFWKPYYAMKEIWQGSDPNPAVPALHATVSALLPWWWWMWLTRNLGGQVVTQLSRHMNGADDVIASCIAQIVFLFPSALAALLAAVVVILLSRRQDERARRQSTLAAPPLTIKGVAP